MEEYGDIDYQHLVEFSNYVIKDAMRVLKGGRGPIRKSYNFSQQEKINNWTESWNFFFAKGEDYDLIREFYCEVAGTTVESIVKNAEEALCG
jgi:hypothetical protein